MPSSRCTAAASSSLWRWTSSPPARGRSCLTRGCRRRRWGRGSVARRCARAASCGRTSSCTWTSITTLCARARRRWYRYSPWIAPRMCSRFLRTTRTAPPTRARSTRSPSRPARTAAARGARSTSSRGWSTRCAACSGPSRAPRRTCTCGWASRWRAAWAAAPAARCRATASRCFTRTCRPPAWRRPRRQPSPRKRWTRRKRVWTLWCWLWA
mmetsp:Transcript_32525/g.83104  ORF Transcript_32525/g.83104 Transcript_32525/m.83104 type:complete len:212 (-) Transcript_32525:167-802(-)